MVRQAENEPAAFAALFPETADLAFLDSFRERLGRVIGETPFVVSLEALPEEILRHNLKL
jgi:hypothetical protein